MGFSMDKQQLSYLLILQTVVEEGSFRSASRQLNIAPSAVSYAVKKLEESLGVQLLNRTTRSIGLSKAGRVLLNNTSSALRMIEDGFNDAKATQNTVAGSLRINTGYSAAKFLIAPHLGAFTKAYPDIVLDLIIDNSFIDIVDKGFDAGIRLHEHVEQDMIAAKIGHEMRSVLVATPQYLDQYGYPKHPRDLKNHKAIFYRFSEKHAYIWEFQKGAKSITVMPPETMFINDHSIMIDALLQNVGMAYIFEDYVDDLIETGKLVKVMEDWSPRFQGFYIYYPQQRMRSALRAFIDFFIEKNR